MVGSTFLKGNRFIRGGAAVAGPRTSSIAPAAPSSRHSAEQDADVAASPPPIEVGGLRARLPVRI